MRDDEDVPYWDGCDDPVLPQWQFVRPFDVEPLDVYGYGSDPTNDELPPDGIFGPVDVNDPDVTPLQRLLYPPV